MVFLFLVCYRSVASWRRQCVEWVRAECARLGGKIVAVEGLTDVLADKRKNR